ncbi:hypothetical protein [uncultured Sulfitobacter sp.]|uniref:hypothetical protein n=1 Tax=uncultured Sulfitobacter sp. TaxID=191468 RepID=UPI002599B4EB|nr:hypothetical protein [uncultured Sulfitobacter sp.]
MNEASEAFQILDWAKFAATLVSPFVALGGGIWLFFIKASQQRADELRRERLAVYRKYLAVLQDHKSTDYDDPASAGLALMEKLSPFHEQVALMAPDNVAVASLKLINSNIGDHYWQNGKRVQYIHNLGRAPTPEEYDAFMAMSNPVREARRELLKEMRKDIVQGTGINGNLTDVEELNK